MVKTSHLSNEEILERIDDLIKELQWLRQAVDVPRTRADATSQNIVEELAGLLGQGTWDEYDPDLDWKRYYSFPAASSQLITD